jgi:HNH endonuclease
MSKNIQITRGQIAIVDDEDYEWLNQWKWSASWIEATKSFRVVRTQKGKTIYMHRLIMDAPSEYDVDHINHNSLDNRKTNLRLATTSQNMQNGSIKKGNTSGYKGVSWNNRYKIFYAQIAYGGKNRYIGRFDDPVQAAKAYDKKAREIFGVFANVNFEESES